jgi:hypothetical protein
MGRWRKVLYIQQSYPDNYVDPAQFLDGLRKNGKVRIICNDFGGDIFIIECMMHSFHRDV